MTDRERDIVLLTVAICRAEVEQILNSVFLAAMDGGSPWGRATMKALTAVERSLPEHAGDDGGGQ